MASADPTPTQFALSADEAFLGRPDHLSPEQLVVMAASSCQLLSFLAVAARARVNVVSYEDDAEGVMPEHIKPISITKIILHPRIVVAAGPSVEPIQHLVEVAHRECYIANSLRTEIEVQPQIEFVTGDLG
jgi:organic hydroperoxide reductase OsmC/OhrA